VPLTSNLHRKAHALPRVESAGETTDFIALYRRLKLFFAILLSKIACQAPKPSKSIKQKEIEFEV
jgi:hypothetical protein